MKYIQRQRRKRSWQLANHMEQNKQASSSSTHVELHHSITKIIHDWLWENSLVEGVLDGHILNKLQPVHLNFFWYQCHPVHRNVSVDKWFANTNPKVERQNKHEHKLANLNGQSWRLIEHNNGLILNVIKLSYHMLDVKHNILSN